MPKNGSKDDKGASKGGWKGPIDRPGQAKLPTKSVQNIKGSAKLGNTHNPGSKRSSY